MSAHYSFEVDSVRSVVRIRMGGLFTLGDVEGFLAARKAAHAKLRCGPNQHFTLNDLRDMKIQHQEVVDAFRDLLAAPGVASAPMSPRFLFRYRAESATPILAAIVISFVISTTPSTPRSSGSVTPSVRVRISQDETASGLNAIWLAM